ncbi:MAG TPA: efflux RND transporter periplasmic adaptor subunit [Bryobacteraceae bacterium]|nr:efflux RND transporter periplasmic adaptor subunit [Bryobacteraceae bacterium]
MKAVLVVLGTLLIAAGFGGGYWYARHGTSEPASKSGVGGRRILYWVDPMHPSYKSDKPGIAPDCGMRLEPVYADEPGAGNQTQKKIAWYRDPQDPNYRSDKPGINPETGNDLVPVYEEPVPGTINVSAERLQLIGVRFGTVESARAEHTIRAVGRIAFDETRISRINSKIEGWVEQLFADHVSQPVRRGEPLLTIYSPEMLASQQEYLLALRSRDMLAGSTVPGVSSHTDSLIEASRRRLELFDISPAQIEEVRRTGKAVRTVTIYSPVAGVITERKVFPRMKITPEMELYTIADLSRVWVLADVFEYEAPNVRVGTPATVTLTSAGGGSLTARVSHILPEVDPQTRTLKVRLDLPNPGLRLRADMFVDVDFRMGRAAALSVPAEAVMDTGMRKTVYVDRGNGAIEPRQVQSGARFGDRIEIVSGLRAGERIVVSGNFLIDSESQMKAAATPQAALIPEAKTSGPNEPAAGSGGHPHQPRRQSP